MQASDRTQAADQTQQGPSAFERLFAEHPKEVGESYWEHFGHSAGYGFRIAGIAFYAFVHALIPGVFKTHASSRICKLADELDDRAQEAREERCRKSGSYDCGL